MEVHDHRKKETKDRKAQGVVRLGRVGTRERTSISLQVLDLSERGMSVREGERVSKTCSKRMM